MGNTHIKPHPRQRNKKQVHWKAAARPHPPGKPYLVADVEPTPDLVTIRWPKPPSDGGSPISGYLIEHRRAGSPHWVRATPLLVQNPELTVSGLEPGWRYQFRVRAENAVGISDPSELSEIITVTLQRSAVTAPRVTQELQDTDALENEKAEFVVHFLGQPPPKVSWYKDAFEIFSSRRIRILTENDRSVLTIHQCSLADEGEIKCTATNRAGHVSTKSKLVVQAPPSVRLPRPYEDGLLFEVGEQIRLKVSIAGRPTPLVFWSHNGESIKNNDRFELEHKDDTSVLKIAEGQREDRGEYEVKAVNKLGTHSQSFLVTITDKPSPPGKARVVMALGKSVTLSWNVPYDDGGCKIGNYIIEYYRLGWNVWLKAATSRQLSTMLGDLIEGSEYKFRVKAESPFGVSEPSEESDVVFIPDAKRGILQPPSRSKSQPGELDAVPVTPTARRKNKPRSLSSTRAEEHPIEIKEDTPPKRPMRTKIKSPSKTPEASPLPAKRDINIAANKRDLETKLNKEIFERSDRSSMARDLAYGSPDIKVKKELNRESYLSSNLSNISSGSDKSSRTPSPIEKVSDHYKVYKVKIEAGNEKNLSPSPKEFRRSRFSRNNSENMTGSSEFMLVLYSDENQKGPSDFDFEDSLIPPPMSLSAPELGMEAPIFNRLRSSASSTELLHERAMDRLYEAAKAEEKELERRRKSIEMKGLNIEIPKIQINSKDQEERLALDRIHSMKRRLSGGMAQQLWTRRQSLKNSSDLKNDTLNNHLEKSNLTPEEKREIMMTRQRSDSEEIEEKVFEQIRNKMAMEKQSSTEKRVIDIVDEDKWADDYVSSTEESSYDEDEDDKQYSNYDTDGEEQTYHPKQWRSMSLTKEEPFEILTKRKDPPSPDFIPKPILKKKESEDISPIPVIRSASPKPPSNPVTRDRSRSLVGTSYTLPLLQTTIPEESSINSRPRSTSLTYDDDVFQTIEIKPKTQRKRAFSLLPQAELLQKSETEGPPMSTRQRSFSLIPQETTPTTISPESIYNFERPKMSFLMQTISAAATISGITAASIVIPDRLIEKQKDAEETQVVVDHYSDIVKNYGNKRRSNTSLNKSRDSLQKSRDSLQKSGESLHKIEESIEEISVADNYQNKPSPTVKTSYMSSEKSNSLPARNYHDNYPSYHLGSKDNAYSSTSSAESGYVSSRTPSATNVAPTNNERFASPPPTDKGKEYFKEPLSKVSIADSNKSKFSVLQQKGRIFSPTRDQFSPEKESGNARTFSPTRNTRPRLFSPTRDMQSRSYSPIEDDIRPLSPILDDKRPLSPTTKNPYSKANMPFSLTLDESRPLSLILDDNRPLSPTMKSPYSKANRPFSPISENPNSRSFSPPLYNQESLETSSKRKSDQRTSKSPISTRLDDIYSSKSVSKRETSTSPMRESEDKTIESPKRLRPPKLREIMTQTSEGLWSFNDSFSGASDSEEQKQLIAETEANVHRFVHYLTHLAIFGVACWFYMFSNELFAIPVLLLLVFRHLQDQYRYLQSRCRQLRNKVSSKIPRRLPLFWRRKKDEDNI